MALLTDTLPVGPPETPEKINDLTTRILANNPNFMTGPGTNTYIIKSPNHIVIIDPGPDLPEHEEAVLKSLGSTKDKTVLMLLTHTHIDHCPLAYKLSKQFNWTIGLYEPDPNFANEVTIADNQELKFTSFSIKVIHTPGHTADHLCYLLRPLNILFSGDHIIGQSTTVILPPEGSMSAYLKSLERIKELINRNSLSAIMPGHGGSPVKPKEFIDQIIKFRLKREDKVLTALQALESATIEQLLPLAYDDTDKSLYPVAKYSLWAHLLKLAQDGVVKSSTMQLDSLWHYIKS
jgi:glyoxylase-like metal-dependent hydrolase (beta-lactamase superfamily II)